MLVSFELPAGPLVFLPIEGPKKLVNFPPLDSATKKKPRPGLMHKLTSGTCCGRPLRLLHLP